MESDFGIDLYSLTGPAGPNEADDDDWVQSYADYAIQQDYGYDETHDDTYGDTYGGTYGDTYGDNMTNKSKVKHSKSPIESLEDLLVSDKILKTSTATSRSGKHHNQKGNNQKVHKQQIAKNESIYSVTNDRPRKRKRSKFKSGVEIFLNEVLCWDIRDLMSDCRATLRLPRMVLPSLTYNNFSELSTVVQQVAIEETRVAILRGCHEPEDVVYLDLSEEPSGKKFADTLIPIRFFVRRGGGELIKPGWIFCLFPLSSDDTHPESMDGRRRRDNKGSSNSSHSRKSSVKTELHQRIFSPTDSVGNCSKGVLATLALGRHSFQSASSGVTMWVHSDTLFRALHKQFPDGSMPSQWVGYAVENIITHQRIASVSYDSPKFPFMNKFLGQKESTHIVFESDGDDSDDNGEVDSIGVCNDHVICEDDATNTTDDDGMESSSEEHSGAHISIDISGLDASQRVALKNTMTRLDRGRSLEMVQGPPGCGKTYFLVHLLMSLVLEKRKRVLVCAPSNKAISVIVGQYSSKRHKDWKDDIIVSIGVEDKFDKCKDNHEDIEEKDEVLFEGCERLLTGMWAECDCQRCTHQPSTGRVNRQSSSNKISSRRAKSTMPPPFLPDMIVSALARVINPSNVLDVLVYKYASNVATAINFLGIAFSACVKFHCTSLLDHNSCRVCVKGTVSAVLNSLSHSYSDMIETLRGTIGEFFKTSIEVVDDNKIFKTSVEKVSASVFEALKSLSCALDTIWSCMDENQSVGLSNNVETANEDVINQLKLLHKIFDSTENSDYVADELLSNAHVVCSTLSTAGCGLMKRKTDTFDVLLVDEAGQCLEGELLIPCFLNPSSLVLIGDPQQLPATVLSMEVQEKLLGISSMQRLMTSAQHTLKQSGYHMLSTQYRMHPDICSFPNCQYYDGKLNTALSVQDRTSIIPNDYWLQKYPVSFVNVFGSENSGSYYSKSRYNLAEADTIVEFLMDLRMCLTKKQTQKKVEIGIITFYAAQVAILKQHITKSKVGFNNSCFRIKVMSVDGFQGSESDIIILSFVRSNKKSAVGFLKDFQRLNVALTRAKHNLVMFGDADTLENSDCKDLQRLILDMKNRSALIDKKYFV